jgi:hypothetical protein
MMRVHSEELHALIDPEGEVVDFDDSRLQRYGNERTRRSAVVRYLISRLGWIEVIQNNRGIRLKCRPSMITEAALATVLFHLADHPESPLALSVLGTEWRHVVHIVRQEAITLLDSMRVQNPKKQMLLKRRRRSEASLHGQTSQALTAYCSTPRSSSEVVEFCKEMYSNGRWSMSHFDSSSDIVMDYVSDGYTPFNAGWMSRGGIQSLDTYAGRDYAQWVARTRAYAIESGEAIFDDVDATIPFPGIGMSRLRYTRATTPIRLACGSMYAVSTAITDTSIQLKEVG